MTYVTVVLSVYLFVCVSVYMSPVISHKLPFGRGTCVVPSNIVLHRSPGLFMGRRDFEGWNPHFAAMPPITKLLFLFFYLLTCITVYLDHVISICNIIINNDVCMYICCQCGMILGSLMLLSSAWLTDVACRLLMKTAFLSKKRSFEYLGKLLFGYCSC